jgi:hypothetical protein
MLRLRSPAQLQVSLLNIVSMKHRAMASPVTYSPLPFDIGGLDAEQFA